MSAAKYVAATMKVPVRDQPDRCSHQSGFFHSPCASPTMYPVSATASSTGSTGSPPGQSPSCVNANIAARFIRSVGEGCCISVLREEDEAASVVCQVGGVLSAANFPRAWHCDKLVNV